MNRNAVGFVDGVPVLQTFTLLSLPVVVIIEQADK